MVCSYKLGTVLGRRLTILLVNDQEMSRTVRKADFFLCKNKGADQLHSNCEADQHLCFCYTDSTIPLLP